MHQSRLERFDRGQICSQDIWSSGQTSACNMQVTLQRRNAQPRLPIAHECLFPAVVVHRSGSASGAETPAALIDSQDTFPY
jgi:hypothetical protein